jgi:hypothetical protein
MPAADVPGAAAGAQAQSCLSANAAQCLGETTSVVAAVSRTG